MRRFSKPYVIFAGLLCLGLIASPLAYAQKGKKEVSKQEAAKKFLESRKKAVVPKERKEAQSIYRSARILIQEGWEEGRIDYRAVENRLEDSIKKDSTFARAYLALGKIYEDQWKWDDAIKIYREATRKTIAKNSAYINMARVYARNGRYNDARKIVSNILKQAPKSGAAKTVLASIMRRQNNDLKAAKKMLREALANSPESLSTFKEMAIVHIQENKLDFARLDLLKAMKIKDSDPSIYNSLGIIFLKQNKKAEAVEAFEKAVERDEQYVPARLNLSALYLESAYFEKALAELELAERVQPRNPAIATGIGVAHRGLGDFKKAQKNFEEALDFEKDYRPALYNLGLLHYRYLNDREKAASYFKRAKSSEPTSASVEVAPTQIIERIEMAEDRQREIASLADNKSDKLDQLKEAVKLRVAIEADYRGVEENVAKLISQRGKNEAALMKLDQQVAKARSGRVQIDKQLGSTVAEMDSVYTKIKSVDGKLLAAENRIVKEGEESAAGKALGDYLDDWKSSYKDLSRAERDVRKIVGRSNAINHSAMHNSFEQASKQSAELVSQLERAQSEVRGAKKDLIKTLNRFSREVLDSQKMADERKANGQNFGKVTDQLVKVEQRLDAKYDELRALDEKRAKLEGNLKEELLTMQDSEKRRQSEEQAFFEDLADRSLEQQLIAVDKQREIAGRRLESLEQKRMQLVNAMKMREQNLTDLWEDIRSIGERWDRQAAQIKKVRSQADELEKSKKQTMAAIEDQKNKLEKLQDQISGLIKQSEKINKRFSKQEKQLAKLQSDLKKNLASWRQAVRKRDTVADQLVKSQSNWNEKAGKLASARASAFGKFKDAELKGQYNKAYSKWKSLYDRHRKSNSNAAKVVGAVKASADKIAVTVDQIEKDFKTRSVHVDKLEKLQAKRQSLIDKRSSKVGSVANVRRQREKIERQQIEISKQEEKLLESERKLVKQRQELLKKGNEIYRELAASLSKRRQTLSRDLFGQAGGKKTSKGAKKK